MRNILADGRWRGRHGIGRFASEVLDRLEGVHELREGPRKLHPIDPFWLAIQIERLRPKVFFTPGFNAPVYCRTPVILTLHDLIHLREPQESGAIKSLYYKTIVRPAARRAPRILTGSQHTRSEILEWVNIPEERVCVVEHGVSAAFTRKGDLYEPGYPYLLYVGNSKPHKNVQGLLHSFLLLRNKVDVELVLVGVNAAETTSWARELQLESHVHTTNNLSEQQLAAFYRGAESLVMPSRYEGFGLPVLEAMACGTPVVASNLSAVPEAAGGAALLVDSQDSQALSEALALVCEDSSTRTELRNKGLQRVRGCTWERTAQQVAVALEECQ